MRLWIKVLIALVVLGLAVIVIFAILKKGSTGFGVANTTVNPNASFSFTNYSAQSSLNSYIAYPDNVVFLGCWNDDSSNSSTRTFSTCGPNCGQTTVKQCAGAVQDLNTQVNLTPQVLLFL